MQRVTKSITEQADALELQGLKLTSWGPNMTTGRVDVQMQSYLAKYGELLRAKFGSDVNVIASNVERPTEAAASRYNDTAPWYGGDALTAEVAGSIHCTSGFAITDGFGRDSVVTGGHCFNTGIAIYTNRTKIGNVASRQYTQGGTVDGELLPAAGGVLGRVWVYDAGQTPYSYGVHGYRHSQEAVNADLSFAGAATNSVVEATTVETGQCFTFRSGHRTCDVSVASSDSETIKGGDSGGPVYEYTFDSRGIQNGVFAHGYILGSDSTGDIYFAREANLISAYNGTLIEG